MAYNPQAPFYVQPTARYPPTSNSTHDDFSPVPYLATGFGYGGPFEITGQQAGPPHPSISLSGGQFSISQSPTLENSMNVRGGRGSSEEKELTPGQRRRKEQNRAAQRAFRERKERHVKELELRLESLEQANSRAAIENDKLKAQLEKSRLENRLLHENTLRGQSPPEIPDASPISFKPFVCSNPPPSLSHADAPPDQFTMPIFVKHPNRGPIHRITISPKTGERLLGAGAAWDLIVCHPLFQQGLVNISEISERLKIVAKCDGQGPVFEESIIMEAIHASRGTGGDELLTDVDLTF